MFAQFRFRFCSFVLFLFIEGEKNDLWVKSLHDQCQKSNRNLSKFVFQSKVDLCSMHTLHLSLLYIKYNPTLLLMNFLIQLFFFFNFNQVPDRIEGKLNDWVSLAPGCYMTGHIAIKSSTVFTWKLGSSSCQHNFITNGSTPTFWHLRTELDWFPTPACVCDVLNTL